MIRAYIEQIQNNSDSWLETLDMIWCAVRYGASPNNYRDFCFKQLNGSKRATYVTNGLSRKMIKQFNRPEFIDWFEDKTKFATHFSEYFHRSWMSTEDLNYDSFVQFLNGKDKFIYKPVGNAQGQGICVYDDLRDLGMLFDEIMQRGDKAILEEWIPQHERFNQIYDKAINCLRIVTIYKDGTTNFLTGGVTWGNGMKIANASASGIVSPVTFETGTLDKPAADFHGNSYMHHPLTGANLIDVQIPYWNEVLAMLKKAAAEIPQVGYVGWDIAITPNGPVLIEGNTTPGYRYYQIPIHMDDQCGNKKKYVNCLR